MTQTQTSPALYFVKSLASDGRTHYWVERDHNDMDFNTTVTDIVSGNITDVVQVMEVIPDEQVVNDCTMKVFAAVQNARADYLEDEGCYSDRQAQRFDHARGFRC